LSRPLVTAGPAIDDLDVRHAALIVLDIDEVVLHFIAPFCILLEEYGARLHAESFRLTGNVRSMSTGAAVSGSELDKVTVRLYEEQQARQAPVDGVQAALARLSVVFADDLPPNLVSAGRSLPRARLVHLMANEIFRPHLPPLPAGALEARNWDEAEAIIEGILAAG
jgi:hypothetical protein